MITVRSIFSFFLLCNVIGNSHGMLQSPSFSMISNQFHEGQPVIVFKGITPFCGAISERDENGCYSVAYMKSPQEVIVGVFSSEKISSMPTQNSQNDQISSLMNKVGIKKVSEQLLYRKVAVNIPLHDGKENVTNYGSIIKNEYSSTYGTWDLTIKLQNGAIETRWLDQVIVLNLPTATP